MPSTQRRTTIALAIAAASIAAPLAALQPAHAQSQGSSTAQPVAPQMQSLQVVADGGIDPGSELRFELRGTPGGRASVRINDGNTVVPLAESSPGVYTGSHVVRRDERIDVNGLLRATLSANNRSSLRNYTFPPALVALAQGSPQQADPTFAQPQDAQAQAQQRTAAPARIERFVAQPDGPLEPGTEVRFELQATPGGRASVGIAGVGASVPLRETRPGVYTGSYTLRKQDRPAAFTDASATLRLGSQVANARLSEPLAQAPNAPATGAMSGSPGWFPPSAAGAPAAPSTPASPGVNILNRR